MPAYHVDDGQCLGAEIGTAGTPPPPPPTATVSAMSANTSATMACSWFLRRRWHRTASAALGGVSITPRSEKPTGVAGCSVASSSAAPVSATSVMIDRVDCCCDGEPTPLGGVALPDCDGGGSGGCDVGVPGE